MEEYNNDKPQQTQISYVSDSKKYSIISPYKNGKKDQSFVNPSLISHDVFYNTDYPKVDKQIPYSKKRQTITEKITNTHRSLTPQPSKSTFNTYENDQKSYRTSNRQSPMNQNMMEKANDYNFKSQKILHIEDYKPDLKEYDKRNSKNNEFFNKNNEVNLKNNENNLIKQSNNELNRLNPYDETHINNEYRSKNNEIFAKNQENNLTKPKNRLIPYNETHIQNEICSQNNENNNTKPINNELNRLIPHHETHIHTEICSKNDENIIKQSNRILPNNEFHEIYSNNPINRPITNGISPYKQKEIPQNNQITNETLPNNNRNDLPKDYEFDRKSSKSNTNTVSSFTRNKDNLICDYCVNQDLIDRKHEENESEDRRNKQIKELNENFYQSILHENLYKQTERKKLLKENREAQLQTIEYKKNQTLNERNQMKNYENEIIQLQTEEIRLLKQNEMEMEKNKKEILKKELENQMNCKRNEKNQYLIERNSSRDLAMNINNQYHNPYLPNRKEYIQEIERQKEMNKEKTFNEREDQRKNHLFNMSLQKKYETEDSKQIKEENQRKQVYAQKILQDIENKRRREVEQKESERSYYKNMYEKINQEEKKLSLQQFYEKKMKEAQISNSLKDQISERRNLEMNSQNDEILKRKLAEIEDVLAAQKIHNYNCKKCHKNYPKSVLNKCVNNLITNIKLKFVIFMKKI